ncbi:MAG: hypothetical protein HY553_00980 [Elusimicrobia bacterium]|nr:hypothetical protein [Elusimicrobiota bacterium]
MQGTVMELVVTGAGEAARGDDPTPFLKSRKTRKFMGLQDELAVVAAGRALESAGLGGRPLGPDVGLYLAVGYIPFEAEDIDGILGNSTVDGRFSLKRFTSDGYQSANPLLTFRCLSNMPAFHISVNFDLQGPYFTTYPGPGQFYVALELAQLALESGLAEAAVVGAVAHQRNFLVEHHHARLLPPVAASSLADGAACLVLEPAERALARGARPKARLAEVKVDYRPFDPFRESRPASETSLGAAELPVALCREIAKAAATPNGPLTHRLEAHDGTVAESVWELCR